MKRVVPISAIILSILLMSVTLDLSNLLNYENQAVPSYITRDNMPLSNPITDEGATLGRVLYYDKKLSSSNTISCASCHIQEFAFGDTARNSIGVNGTTHRHSMRLINTRFGEETKFFWDERANSLEEQSTMPIQNDVEMGYSGTEGDADLDSLISELQQIDYYNELFTFVFGDSVITVDRMQLAMAQFIRSIQSFDSKFDVGREQVQHDTVPFPNFTPQENAGKALFLTPLVMDSAGLRTEGGLGCNQCHRSPEFDIDPLSLNNGIIVEVNTPGQVFDVTRSPTLRDLFDANGNVNGPMMHTGNFSGIGALIARYDSMSVQAQNTKLDPRLLSVTGQGQQLLITDEERSDLRQFLKTLTGSNVYTDPKWSDPFDENGNLTIEGSLPVSAPSISSAGNMKIYPNPSSGVFNVEIQTESQTEIQITVFNILGDKLLETESELVGGKYLRNFDLTHVPMGVYMVRMTVGKESFNRLMVKTSSRD